MNSRPVPGAVCHSLGVVCEPYRVHGAGLFGTRSIPFRQKSLGALRDITERLSGEQRDHFWFEQSSVGYSVSEPTGHRRMRVNPAQFRILGYSERELLAMNFLDTTHPDYVPAAQEWRSRTRAGSDEPYRTLQRFIRKDGKIVWAA